MSHVPTLVKDVATPPSRPEQAPRQRPDEASRHRWWVLGIIGIAQLMVVLDGTIVNIALPSAQQDLGFSDGNRQWVITAYALAFGSLLLLGGRIADLFGRKATFLVGLVGFAGASALGGAATSFAMLVTARAGQGVFGALLAPAALALLTTTFTDPRERAKAFTVYGAIAGAGGAIGLLLGGILTEYLNWRWTLYVNLLFAVIAFAGGKALLRRTARDKSATLDIPGTILVSAGLFCLVYGFANAETYDWDSPATWGLLTVGAVLLAAFTRWQTKAAHPLLPLRVLLDRNRGASYLSVLISGAGLFGVFLFLTYYMQQSLDYTPVKTGLAFLPMVAGLMITNALATTVLVPRIGPKPVVPLGMGLTAAGMAWMTTLDLTSGYASPHAPADHRRPRTRPGDGARDEPGHLRCRRGGRGRRLGHRQHHAAGRRIDRHRTPHHALGRRRDGFPGRQEPPGPGHRRPGRAGELLHGLLVVGRILPRRPRHQRPALPPRSPGPGRERRPRRPHVTSGCPQFGGRSAPGRRPALAGRRLIRDVGRGLAAAGRAPGDVARGQAMPAQGPLRAGSADPMVGPHRGDGALGAQVTQQCVQRGVLRMLGRHQAQVPHHRPGLARPVRVEVAGMTVEDTSLAMLGRRPDRSEAWALPSDSGGCNTALC